MLCRQILLLRKGASCLNGVNCVEIITTHRFLSSSWLTAVTAAILLHERQTLCVGAVWGLVTRSQLLLSCRSGKLTPSQVAKNIIAMLEDCDKSTPPLRAIVQWDQEQIMLVMSASGRREASATLRAVASIRRGRGSSTDILHRKICTFFLPPCVEDYKQVSFPSCKER